MNPKALILTGYGINCEEESAKVFEMSGADSSIVHINDLIENPQQLDQFQILTFPGGFSYGDDTGSGNAFANKLRNNINEHILKFIQKDTLTIGICNGFQVITNLGLVPACPAQAAATDNQYGKRQAALMPNKQARYECRWVHIKTASQKSPWLKDIDTLHLPIAHGEGNFYTDPETLKKITANKQIAFRYVQADGSPAKGEFPHNPNGSLEDIAAITDPSGRVLGMMPHPERFNCFTNESGWQKKKEELLRAGKDLPTRGDGLKLFENAVNYFK